VSETWFSKSLPDSFINLKGYTIFRSDRLPSDELRHGGGVAIYVRSSLNCKVILKNNDNASMEYIFIQINTNYQKILIGTIYRRRHDVDIQPIVEVLEEISFNYTKIIVTGDLNSDILKDDSVSQKFSDLHLFPVNSLTPTHFSARSNTLLDVFFVNEKEDVLFYDQLSVPVFSRHDLIFITFKHPKPKTNQTTTFLDFNNINYPLLDSDFSRINWHEIFTMPSVDDQVEFLNKNVLNLFHQHVPIRIKSLKKTSQPWFNANIKQLIKKRDEVYRRWKRYKTLTLYSEFRSLRNQAVRAIKNSKAQYYSEKFANATNNSAKWRTIKEIGLNKKCSHEIQADLNELNQKYVGSANCGLNREQQTCDQNICDSFLTYMNSNGDNSYNGAIFTTHTFNFKCVDVCEVLYCLNAVKSNSIGLDGLHPKFLKIILIGLLPFITHIFNTILTKSIYPKAWKIAKIIPIPKTDNEYRPIAILPYLSKAFEILLYRQMYNFFVANSLLTNRQSGFRPKRSCTTAVLDVSEDIRKNSDAKKPTFLILLDCTKAFESIDHVIFCYKLQNWYGFSTQAVKLISSYLSERSQCVSSSVSLSSPLRINKGVPQGSVLGPFLFSVYINDFPLILKKCSCHLYADDFQLYMSCDKSNISNGVNILNDELQRVDSWSKANKLQINPKKSKCLLIYNKHIDPSSLPTITIDHSIIEYVDKAKNLGIMFNTTLSWNNQINIAVGKVNGMLRCLWSTQYYTPLEIRLLIAQTYLIPVLLYGCELFANSDAIHSQKLKVCYNNIARYIFKLKRRDHVSEYAYKINNISFDNLLKAKVLLLLHKIIFSQEPDYLFERLRFTLSPRNNNIVLERHTTSFSGRHFFIYAARLWNSLNSNTQQIGSAVKFKQAIFSELSNHD